ncbi:MAG: DUF2232 domain-containing protein [Alphaproteobacteria bacterium]
MRHDHVLSIALSVFSGVFSFFMLSLGAVFALPLLFLGYFAQLPFFLLCFFASYEEVLLGGAVASLLHFLFAAEGQLVTYILLYVTPAVLFAYFLKRHKLLQKSGRARATSKKIADPLIGRCLLLMGCVLTVFFHVWIAQTDLEKILGEPLQKFAASLPKGETSINQTFFSWVQNYFSGIISFSWMLMTLCNLMIAQLLFKWFQKNQQLNLSFNYWKIENWNYWLLVASLVGIVFFSGDLSVMAKNLAIISLFPFLLEGFSVVHRVYRAFSKEKWGIVALYGLLVFLVWPLLALVCLGLFEPWIHIRRRLGDPS